MTVENMYRMNCCRSKPLTKFLTRRKLR